MDWQGRPEIQLALTDSFPFITPHPILQHLAHYFYSVVLICLGKIITPFWYISWTWSENQPGQKMESILFPVSGGRHSTGLLKKREMFRNEALYDKA